MADEDTLGLHSCGLNEGDDVTLSDIDDDEISLEIGDSDEESSCHHEDIDCDSADADNSSTGIRSAELNRDDRFQLSWADSSWTLTESMDTDHFFLVPPTRDMHISRPRSLGRRQFVLPSSAVRRSGDNTFPISPPTRTRLEAAVVPLQSGSNGGGGDVTAGIPPPPISPAPSKRESKEGSPSEARALRVYEASLRQATPNVSEEQAIGHATGFNDITTSSPTGVATHNLNSSDTGRRTPTTEMLDQGPAPVPAPSLPLLSPTSKKRAISRQDSLTYSIGQSIGYPTGGASSVAGRSTKNGPTSTIADADEDGGGSTTLFRNLYEDDQSLYLDEDCLTECAEPYCKANRAFITSAEAQDASALSKSHDMSPILKLFKTLTSFCRPHCTPRVTVSSKPMVNSSKHRTTKSDPELLTDRLEDRLIMTKKTVETAPWERSDGDGSEEATSSSKIATTVANGPPVIIKFRPSQLTSSCIHELAFQIDSKADFVLDDTRSLPDSLFQPSLDDD